MGYIGQHSHVDFDPNVIEAMENDEDAISPLDDGGEESGLDDRLAEAIERLSQMARPASVCFSAV